MQKRIFALQYQSFISLLSILLNLYPVRIVIGGALEI